MATIFPQSNFYNAQNAFVMLFDAVNRQGLEYETETKELFNIGFYIQNTVETDINVDWFNWKKEASKAIISAKQLKDIIKRLHQKSDLIWLNEEQTIGFSIVDEKVCLNIVASALDIWTDFCTKQYYFSKLQQFIAKGLHLKVGWSYYFIARLQLTKEHYNADYNFYKLQGLEE